VPLIAAKIGGLEEMLGEAERGLAFAPGDARALAACVARLQGDPALALRLIGNGRQALAAHRPEASLAILEDTYRSLIG
jgi:glycosyltransferase involved in cell wall biosynthesis